VRGHAQRWLRRTSVAIGVKISGVSLMPMDHPSSSEHSPVAASCKKPYEKPAFRHEQVFVTTALSCGKITTTQTGCGLITKVS
jgi:hypothetical protein